MPGVDVLFKNLQRFMLDQMAVKNGEIYIYCQHTNNFLLCKHA